MSKNLNIGSSFDSFLEEEGLLEEVQAIAQKRVIAWQLTQGMAKNHLTKMQMSKIMKTSRASLNRLLDPNNPSVTLLTMERAAAALGMKLKIELVESEEVNR